jgi:hypothetical protein
LTGVPRAAALAAAFAVVALVGLGLPPRPVRVPEAPAQGGPFAWSQDSVWRALESSYRAARADGCGRVEPAAARELSLLAATVDGLDSAALDPGQPVLRTIESRFMSLGAPVAACPGLLAEYVTLSGRLRDAAKRQSARWDLTDRAARERLYRMLYGTRAAVEEVMRHHPDRVVPLLPGRSEPSATPAATVRGVEVRSGDILVSRGGYPTSALIARGSDFPGNFSHIGLVHVDSVSGAVSVIEAHIEASVAVTTADGYLRDKKLRIMVLRPRADLPQLRADPLLPHRAASRALQRARDGHIPYDFAMDYGDPSRLFCSEVASSVYADQGLPLWMGISTISRPGLRRWLASLGVRHFATQEPSDLEYDPQLAVVAEWRDADALEQDHIDNAVVDALLERADTGEDLTYAWYRLPPARLAKAYSALRVALGGHGPIPEGMSAAAALRHEAFVARQRALAGAVRTAATRWAAAAGYPAPYWVLVALAREAAAGADVHSGARSP